MSIKADSLIDRLYLKKQVNKWKALAILFAIVTALVAARNVIVPDSNKKGGDYIARLTISGFVGDDQRVYDLISDIKNDRKAKAVIVWLDTPGGSAVGGEEIYTRLRELAKIKPVVSVMRSVSASAGYMIALGGDYILARPGTITGSIGVVIETAEITGLIEKLGINPITIKSSPLKASPSPFEKANPAAEKVLKDMIMDFYNHFVDITTERRKLPRKKVVSLADGRVYSGTQAVENKLIDAIGGEKEAVEWLAKNRNVNPKLTISDVEIEEEHPLIDRIINGVVGDFWQKSRVKLDGLLALWHP
ncbi:MAG: signal peptide peptidase SppA [Rickettsiales bacterium]